MTNENKAERTKAILVSYKGAHTNLASQAKDKVKSVTQDAIRLVSWVYVWDEDHLIIFRFSVCSNYAQWIHI